MYCDVLNFYLLLFFLLGNKTFSMNHFIEWSPRKINICLRTEVPVVMHSACVLEPNPWVPVLEVPCISTKILASHLIFLGGNVFAFFIFTTCEVSNLCGGWKDEIKQHLCLAESLANSAQEMFPWKTGDSVSSGINEPWAPSLWNGLYFALEGLQLGHPPKIRIQSLPLSLCDPQQTI